MQRYGFNIFVYTKMNMWVKTKTETTYLHHPASGIRNIRFSRNSSDSSNFPNLPPPPPRHPWKLLNGVEMPTNESSKPKLARRVRIGMSMRPSNNRFSFLVCRTAFYTDLSFFSRRVMDSRVQTDPAVYTYFNGSCYTGSLNEIRFDVPKGKRVLLILCEPFLKLTNVKISCNLCDLNGIAYFILRFNKY